MGTPTIGGQTTGAVTENSGAVVSGDLDDVGFRSGNNDDTWSISGSASYGTATIDPSTGTWSYDLDDSNPVVDALDPGDTLIDTFTVNMLDADGQSDTQDVTITITGAVCFAAGTLIDTADGPRPVESLHPGARIRTLDHGLQPLRWLGRQAVTQAAIRANPKLRPVRIAAGALGPGLPQRDLRVSRQHRIFVSGPLAAEVFGATEVLIPAIKLVGLPGIAIDRTARRVEYFHLLLDAHQIVIAEGAPSESLLPGPQAMAMLPPDQQAELTALLADTGTMVAPCTPARPIPQRGHLIRRFCARLRNRAQPPIAQGGVLAPVA